MNTDTTSLFTDIVGATDLAVRIGDAAWAELLERHNAIVRAPLNALGGREMDTAGDGFFAIFTGVPDALSAATGIREAVRPLSISLRLGLHTGDCHVADNKCTGLAIHICARIVALAEPNEVLVSQAVYDAAGPKFHFVERGTHALRGIPGEWKLYALVNSS
ncbi:MAG: adenylate/guanylate cyclase domain-containing protein [Gaiellaceae bacterium]